MSWLSLYVIPSGGISVNSLKCPSKLRAALQDTNLFNSTCVLSERTAEMLWAGKCCWADEMNSVSLARSGVLRPCSGTWTLGDLWCVLCSQQSLVSSQGNTGVQSPTISRRSKCRAAGNKTNRKTSSPHQHEELLAS